MEKEREIERERDGEIERWMYRESQRERDSPSASDRGAHMAAQRTLWDPGRWSVQMCRYVYIYIYIYI